MIDLRTDLAGYLAIWKSLLFMAQFLPGTLFFLRYALPHQRCSSLITLPSLLIILAGGCAGLALIQRETAPVVRAIVYNFPTIAMYCLLLCALLLLSLACFDIPARKQLYVALNIIAYTLMLSALLRAVTPLVQNLALMISMYYYLIIFTVSHDLVLTVGRRLILPLMQVEPDWLQKRVYLLPAVLCVILLMCMMLPVSPVLIALTLSLCGLYLAAIRLMLIISSSLASNRQFGIRMKQMEDFYVNLTQNIQQIRAYRHDIRHHFILLQRMNHEGLSEELDRYLTSYLQSIPPDPVHSHTGNYYVDALIYHFFHIAQSEGIHTISQISLPSDMHIASYDLCAIFGNCLENALEACRQQDSGRSFIRVQGEAVQGKIVLIFSNSFNGHIYRSEQLLSTKPGGDHGYGIRSVEHSASRYGGKVKVDYTDQVFRISILLNPPRSEKE